MHNSFINIRIVHLFGWLAYFIILTVFFSSTFKIDFALYQATQAVLLHAALFYFNAQVLMPKLIDKQKYVWYIFSIIILIVAALSLLYFLNFNFKPFGEVMPRKMGRNSNFSSSLLTEMGDKSKRNLFILSRSILRNFSTIIAVILLSIVYKIFYNKIISDQQKVNLQNEHLLSEMKFLKSQINPHFLFNSLNNIYTLVQMKDDKAPDMLMKLSEMLRYMLYECNDEFVPIGKEIKYINNYINLQQLKTEFPQDINVDFNTIDESFLIPPLLLIPFIENSFKHSKIESEMHSNVNIYLKVLDQSIQFEITNSMPMQPISKQLVGGIGLENVKRRLELLYANRYELYFNETKQEYSVTLNIRTK